MRSATAERRSSSMSCSACGTAGRTAPSSATRPVARYFDPAKLHTLNHRGETFAVKGPLNVARPLQGYPVIAQAGSSGPGQDLGARIADLIYTAQKTKADACAFYASVKAHGAAAGRDPDFHAGHARHPRHPGPHPAGRAGPVRPVAGPGASPRRPADADRHVRRPHPSRSGRPAAAPAGAPQRGEKRARESWPGWARNPA